MFERYAIYYTATGAFATHGAAWLGWDVAQGQPVAQPTFEGLKMPALTETPRKYGFHGTVKPPFHLASGRDEQALRAATQDLSERLSPVTLPGLEVATLGRFLALVPTGDAAELRAMAADVVRDLDSFRALPTPEELAKRRKAPLSAAQEQNLQDWGYPHVMDQFRFHMTLTNRLPRADIPSAQHAAQDHFAPVLPQPFVLDALTLAGQRADGMFVTVERFALG